MRKGAIKTEREPPKKAPTGGKNVERTLANERGTTLQPIPGADSDECTPRTYSTEVAADRKILRTVFRDTPRPRAISLMVLPLKKYLRESAQSSQRPASRAPPQTKTGSFQQSRFRGLSLHAE